MTDAVRAGRVFRVDSTPIVCFDSACYRLVVAWKDYENAPTSARRFVAYESLRGMRRLADIIGRAVEHRAEELVSEHKRLIPCTPIITFPDDEARDPFTASLKFKNGDERVVESICYDELICMFGRRFVEIDT